ncbi:hypothetical protein D3C71_1710000 [compost metagenome]
MAAATLTAFTRFNAPSADRAVPGRIDPTTTMGLLVCTVRLRKYAVSARVSVPWVMTTPSTSACLTRADTRLASTSRLSLVKLSEAIWKTCSPRTLATLDSSGSPASSLSTGTLAAL